MRLPSLAAAALAAGGLFLTAPDAGAEPERVDAPIDQPVSTFTLDNGMRAVVIEDHRAPVVTHMVWYPIGAADEPWGQSGIAHFLEHLMFKGTDEIPDGAFSKIVAENGGQDNAFTSWDYTGYFQRIAADRLGLVMKMEADRMVDLRITEEHVETEREVILEERASRTDNDPSALFGEEMRAALYRNHPYAVPIIGWRHEMERLSREDALDFYRRFYSPDNAILVVAGDVTPAEVERLAREHYGPLEPSGASPEPRPVEPPHRAARRLDMADPRVRQPYVMRLYEAPSYRSGDAETAAALSVLSDVLGSGKTARLTQSLEFGDGPAVGSAAWYYSRARDASSFGLYAAAKPGRTLDEVEAGIDEVIARIKAEGPTEAELERVKNRARADLVYAQDSQSSLARLYGAALAVGLTVEDVARYPEVLQGVTAEDVKRVANEYLVAERSVTGRLTRETTDEAETTDEEEAG
ncbi:MAG: M16 family metallopeptidase [Paracoccaceae bacterium]